MKFINKKKLYILPMKFACNANCSWCLSKNNNKNAIKEKMTIDEEFKNNFKKYIPFLKKLELTKLEFTGGGEPFLNENLQEIIDYISNEFPDTYKKLYTNGFLLKHINGIDEINISRSHWDSDLNKKIYRSKFQNDLKESVSFFKKDTKTIRTCTVLQKGLIDSEEKAIDMINKFPEVTTFVFRPMTPDTKNHNESFVNFNINHPKAQKDEIDCTCHKAIVLAPNGKLYYDFNLTDEIFEDDLL